MADITYILNDPSTPNLMVPMTLPVKPGFCDFKVDGYRGATPTIGTLEHQAACAYVTIANALNLANKHLKKPLGRWSQAHQLLVQPRAGKQLNAFYDRQALRFFYATDPVTKNMVYAVNSTDVVAHELGHAILDALRPDLFNMQAQEIWAFHEAFGDIHAILNMLQHDLVLDVMLQETGGDLRRSNVATKLAEEMGTAIFNMTGGRMGHTSGMLRNAVNDFKYVDPATLPRQGKDNQLTSECHSFSRVFTGAWYDILVSIYESEVSNFGQKTALIMARDVMANYTFQAMPLAAATVKFYNAVAKAMLVVDKANNYKYNTLMNNAFVSRGILRQPVRPMVNFDFMAFQTMIEPSDEVYEEINVSVVRNKKCESLPLPFYMLNVDVPADTFYEFDDTGSCVDVISVSAQELVEHAHWCVGFLREHDMIRPDKLTPFEIDSEGNLIRSHFACCWNRNSEDPNAPEYGKGYKPENNAGCMSCFNFTETEITPSSDEMSFSSPRMLKSSKPLIITERNRR